LPEAAWADGYEMEGVGYRRRRPERTLLYQIVERHYPAFVEHLAAAGKQLPTHVRQAFDGYLECGRLEHGFLRLRCDSCHAEHLLAFSCKRRGFCPSCGARRMADGAAWLVEQVLPERPIRQWVLSLPFPLRFLLATHPALIGRMLGIVNRVIAAHLVRQAGYTQQTARTGAVTLIQRFGSTLNLNIHFHMLFLDGVYEVAPDGTRLRFRWVRAPTSAQLTQLAHTIARRVGRLLEREGLLERDTEQLELGEALDPDDPMPDLAGHSITYRIAVGPHRGRKVFTLQTLPDSGWEEPPADAPGNVAGFSLHAGVAVKRNQREKLERLCRYICRPPVSEKRLFITPRGDIGYSLKTPYREGTTHVIFEPLDFIARLAALVPPPRLNLTRFHGVFAPNSPYRARITPARRGRGATPTKPAREEDRAPAERQAAMRWAKRLKRVFQIDVETCPKCGGSVKVIACIEDPPVIERILKHLAKKELPGLWPKSRAPPVALLR
jgi:hypothetical protein